MVAPKPSLTVKSLRSAIPALKRNGTQRDDLAHAYSVWWKHQRLNSGKKEDEVWVIRLENPSGKVQEYRCATEAQARQLALVLTPKESK